MHCCPTHQRGRWGLSGGSHPPGDRFGFSAISLTDHPLCSVRSSWHVSEDHDKRVPPVHLVLRHLQTRAEIVCVTCCGAPQICIDALMHVELIFSNLGCGVANVTIAHSPLIPEAPQSQPPQPAPSHDPSEKQRPLSHRVLVITVTTSLVPWIVVVASPLLVSRLCQVSCMVLQATFLARDTAWDWCMALDSIGEGILPIPLRSTSIIIDSVAVGRQRTISLWFSIVNPNLWGGSIVTTLLQLDRQSKSVTAVLQLQEIGYPEECEQWIKKKIH